MKVAIFNVGGALSSYIEVKGKKVVIDLGKGNDFSPVNDFLVPLFQKKGYSKYEGKFLIDQLILSHPHGDHISDLTEFDKSFFVRLYTTPNDKSIGAETYKNVNWQLVDDPDSDEVKKVRAMYAERNLPLTTCDTSNITISYIYPKYVEDDNALVAESYTNNISISVFIHSGYTIFFAGDVQKEGMVKHLSNNQPLKKMLQQGVDFLICPHHGLRSSFSTDLFEAMKDKKTQKLNIVSEKETHGSGDKRQVDSRYSTADYCKGENSLSTPNNPVYQRKTSNGHIFIDDDATVTISNDIQLIIDKF